MCHSISFRLISPAILVLLLCGAAVAQTTTVVAPPAPQTPAAPEGVTRKPQRRVPSPPPRVTVIRGDGQTAPQVVTIVHRLSGVKLLRLLRRQSGERGVIETIDPQALMNDAHASIIAGWAMDDGKIIARLPQAAAEMELTDVEGPVWQEAQRGGAATTFAMARRPDPDLIVITSDGRKYRAHLIGLDALTGLSVLQIAGDTPDPATKAVARTPAMGEGIEIFAPQPATASAEREAAPRNTYVKLGKIDATVS